MSELQNNKEIFQNFRRALYDIDPANLQNQLRDMFTPDCQIHLAHPLGEHTGSDALYDVAYAPLIQAIPDLERRDYIVISGSEQGENWVGAAGFYTGVFENPWMDIPATRHIVTMRYCEFFRFEDGKISELYSMWDIPEVMMQARAWPMAPSLGKEYLVPGPATGNYLSTSVADAAHSAASLAIVNGMLHGISKHAEGGPESMGLENYWHPKMMWYGPAGIGSMRRVSGFRNWHQIPFLAGMPDRAASPDQGGRELMFAEGDFVGYSGYPCYTATISGDGWMGIAPAGKKITVRSLDFWRCENDRIRENWVIVDLLHVYDQIGVDVFRRMREITVDRRIDPPNLY